MSKLTTEIVARIEKTGAATSRECIALAKEIRIYRGQVARGIQAYDNRDADEVLRYHDGDMAALAENIDGGE